MFYCKKMFFTIHHKVLKSFYNDDANSKNNQIIKMQKKIFFLNFEFLYNKYKLTLYDYILEHISDNYEYKDIKKFLSNKLLCVITYIDPTYDIEKEEMLLSIVFGFQEKDKEEFIKQNININKLFLINNFYEFNIKAAAIFNTVSGDVGTDEKAFILDNSLYLKNEKNASSFLSTKFGVFIRFPFLILNDFLNNSIELDPEFFNQEHKNFFLYDYNFDKFHNYLMISTYFLYEKIKNDI